MNLKIKLPDEPSAAGYDLEIQLRRIPEASMAVKVAASGAAASAAQGKPAFIYGRGRGSTATEKAQVVLRIDPETVAAARANGTNSLAVTTEDLKGNAVDPSTFEVESVTLRPRV